MDKVGTRKYSNAILFSCIKISVLYARVMQNFSCCWKISALYDAGF